MKALVNLFCVMFVAWPAFANFNVATWEEEVRARLQQQPKDELECLPVDQDVADKGSNSQHLVCRNKTVEQVAINQCGP